MYRNFIKKLNKVNEGLISVEKAICFVVYALLILFLFYQVLARFIFKIPTAWSEEGARYLFIVVTYLACGYTLHYNKHVDMNLIDTFLMKAKNPKKAFFIMDKITMLANLVFTSIFMSLYWPFLMKIRANGKMAVAFRLPMWIVMLMVFVGIALMFVHSLVLLLQPYEGDDKKDDTQSGELPEETH